MAKDSVKGAIQELIIEVQKTNMLLTTAESHNAFRNAALEMINNNTIGNHLASIDTFIQAAQTQLGIINKNIVDIGESNKQQQDAMLDFASGSNWALQKMNNEMVDTAEGIKAMQDAAKADKLNNMEAMVEQTKQNEALIAALKANTGAQTDEEDSKDPKKKDKDSKNKGSKFGTMMKDIGAGMLDAGKGLLALGAAVWIIADAFGKFAAVSWKDMSKGLLVLGGLALAAKAMARGNGKESWKPIAAIAGSMLALSFAFEKFASLDWGNLAKGLVVLGALAIAVKLMSGATGAAAMLAIGASVLVMAFAFEKFAALDWEGLSKGLIVLGALTAVTVALGALAPVVLVGAAAMLAIGAAMWIAAKAFEVVSESMTKFNAGLQELASIDAGALKNTAGALGTLGSAMAAFGAGQAAAGLGTLVSNLLTIGQDSPVEQIMKLAGAGDGLLKTAEGLDAIATAMQRFAGISADSMKAINDFPWIRATAFAAAGGTMSVQGATVSGAKQQLSNAQGENSALNTDKAIGQAAAASTAATNISTGGTTVVNNAGPTAIMSSKTTSWDPEDMWARGGMSAMGA